MPINDDYKFRPRGIEKWHAFAALIDGDDQKSDAHIEEEIDVELFDDYLTDLNYTVSEALVNNSIVLIEYIKNNSFKTVQGQIDDVDKISNYIVVDDNKIPIKDITSIKTI